MPAQVVQLRRRPATRPLAPVVQRTPVDATAPSRPLLGLVRPLPFLANWYKVDDWGRDDTLIRLLGPLARLRWDVSVGGTQHIPSTGAALLVANARRLSMSTLYASWALSQSIERPVRFVGRPDIAPIGPLMRRLGALLLDPAEVAGALRNGEVVLISASPTGHPRLVGNVDHALLTGAVLHGTPVLPVVTMSTPVGRAARVEVGEVAPRRRRRRGPLAEVELADDVQHQLQKMLDELGGMRTGGPLDWLGEG
jgi:1-acyl-sn-glycerol-3-phosphate acyltransferase